MAIVSDRLHEANQRRQRFSGGSMAIRLNARFPIPRIAYLTKWAVNCQITCRRIACNKFWESRIQRTASRPTANRLCKPVIHLYAVCWNEEKIIPYFLDHYTPYVDEFHIYDNGSTDSSLELLAACPKATVHPFDTHGEFDDATNLNIKNTAWKRSAGKADFVVVSDMDEFLYHPHLDVVLATMKRNRFTILKPQGVQMVSEQLPPHDGKHLLTELISKGIAGDDNYSKTILFDPNRVEINFQKGCHNSHPCGKVKMFYSDHVKLLHFKYVGRDEVLRKTRIYRERLSETNRARGWGRHYLKSDEEIMAIFDWYIDSAKNLNLP